eukprot:TRINITY_DN32098_c0_g1_i2.p1 TRINITY_DN32098_c0_g1~~TRINITY_DN32098_c0_g1_i2.p1  ORF type:complete len:146 (+),score=29.91 TRINITY_DN32098_c0_g1_i2:299-736(+)
MKVYTRRTPLSCETCIIPNCKTQDSLVFFLKRAGNCCQFFESQPQRARQVEFFKQAWNVISENDALFGPLDSTRLIVALDYSVALYDLNIDPEKAVQVAQLTFDNARSALDQDVNGLLQDDHPLKNEMMLMTCLRDYVSLWNSTD